MCVWDRHPRMRYELGLPLCVNVFTIQLIYPCLKWKWLHSFQTRFPFRVLVFFYSLSLSLLFSFLQMANRLETPICLLTRCCVSLTVRFKSSEVGVCILLPKGSIRFYPWWHFVRMSVCMYVRMYVCMDGWMDACDVLAPTHTHTLTDICTYGAFGQLSCHTPFHCWALLEL